MVVNPCCCTTRNGTKAVAIFNIVVSVCSVIMNVVNIMGGGRDMGVATKNSYDREETAKTDAALADTGADTEVLVTCILILIFAGSYLALQIVLLVGADKRHHGKCKFWFIVTLVLLVLSIIRGIYKTVKYGTYQGAEAGKGYLIGLLIGVAITLWELLTVYAFMEEIKTEERSSGLGLEMPPPYNVDPYKLEVNLHSAIPMPTQAVPSAPTKY